MRGREKAGLIVAAVVVPAAVGSTVIWNQAGDRWETTIAEVTGFGGQSGRRGSVDVYVKYATGYGVIQNIRPDRLNCRIGERVAVEQSGSILRGLPGTCRTSAKLPGQIL